jgi:hypothetical protein
MFSIVRIASRAALSGCLLLLFAASAFAQANTETVTLQVDVTLPVGTQVTGTALIQRQPGTMTDDISFVGTINGSYASLKATGSEAWSGAGEATFTIDKITEWNTGKKQPPLPMTFQVSQPSAGLLLVNGAPVAISGELKAPGSGSASYVVTAAGNGPQVLTTLPNTGEGPAMTFTPVSIALSLVASGLALVAFGLGIGARRRRSQDQTVALSNENK